MSEKHDETNPFSRNSKLQRTPTQSNETLPPNNQNQKDFPSNTGQSQSNASNGNAGAMSLEQQQNTVAGSSNTLNQGLSNTMDLLTGDLLNTASNEFNTITPPNLLLTSTNIANDPKITPPNSSQVNQQGDTTEELICALCSNEKNCTNFVGCDKCNNWFHFICVKVDGRVRRRKHWYCPDCLKKDQTLAENMIELRSNSSKSHSSSYVAKKELEMKMLEECHQLELKQQAEEEAARQRRAAEEDEARKKKALLEKEYIKKRYQLTWDMSTYHSDASTLSSEDETINSEEKSKLWLDSHPPNNKGLPKCRVKFNESRVPQSQPPKTQTPNTLSEAMSNKNNEPSHSHSTPSGMKNNQPATIKKSSTRIRTVHQQSKHKPIPDPENVLHSTMYRGAYFQGPAGYADNTFTQQGGILPPNNFNLLQYDDPTTKQPPLDTTFTMGRMPAICNQMNSSEPIQKLNKNHLAARQSISKDLPIFDGNPQEWSLFYSNYRQSTENCGYTNAENLLRLQKCLKGKAYEAVKANLTYPNAVPSVINTLRSFFGRPELILHVLIKKINEEPAVKPERLDMLIQFSLKVDNICSTMEIAMLEDHLRNPLMIQNLVDKLPSTLKMEWGEYKRRQPRTTLIEFNHWLLDKAESAKEVTLTEYVPSQSVESKPRPSTKQRGFINTHSETASPTSPSKSEQKCPLCNGEIHTFGSCEAFKKLDRSARWKAVKTHKRCRSCLGRHFNAKCLHRVACGVDGCKFKHHHLLHSNQHPKPGVSGVSRNVANPENKSSESSMTHQELKRYVLYRIVPIILHGNGISLKTFAFIDEGSSITLIEDAVAEMLNLKGQVTDLCLRWTGDVSRVEKNSKCVSLEVSSIHNSKKYKLSSIRTIASLNLPVQSLKLDFSRGDVEYLKDVPIECYENAKPTVLIGLDNYSICTPLEVIEKGPSKPIATRSKLGWSVYGPYHPDFPENNGNIHVCDCKMDESLHDMVKQFFSLENFGVRGTNNVLMSKDDERALQILQSTTKRIGDRFESGLLWKDDDRVLPESYSMALRRLICLERKLQKDNQIQMMCEQIEYYLRMGYATKLRPNEIKTSKPTWYLPIFTVRNPNKPKKIRIVWDAAAVVEGVSLNSKLLKGPDKLPLLPHILYRFRERPVAICGDIKEMYHQVQIRQEDRQVQRFLWRNGDRFRDPEVYVMNVMIFGSTCSPSTALFVMNENAKEFSNQYPRAVTAISDNHYVDDWLDSVDTPAEMIDLVKKVTYVHAKGGFKITNWLSNSEEVSSAISDVSESNAKSFASLESPTEKVLGMWWKTAGDKLTFVMNKNRLDVEILNGTKCPTKRQVLRTLMTVFDPLGLISFFLIYIKILLQDIWRTSIGWDEEITSEQQDRWIMWTKGLSRINEVEIPRCYVPAGLTNTLPELHIFVDASQDAYACVAFIRVKSLEKITCSLIGSKTKVAPLKPLSIPRMELQAAVLGARFAQHIVKGHTVSFTKRVFWSDSQNVLCWLRSNTKNFKQFVALRIGEILDSTEVSEWRWVPSDLNPADDATKWKGIPHFDSTNRWYSGDIFIAQHEDQWPSIERPNDLPTDVVFIHNTEITKKPIYPMADATRFNYWYDYVVSQAYIVRFIQILLKQIPMDRRKYPIVAKEFRAAEILIYKQCQRDEYEKDIIMMQSNDGIMPPESKIFNLSPYVDDQGLLRVKGRIDACVVASFGVKRPIILPYCHPVSELIVRSYHLQFNHISHECVINEIRQLYMIPRIRILLKKIRSSCQECRNRRAVPTPPEMAELPFDRVAAFERPFKFAGVDCFGPFEVAVGRRVEKRWGVLFTCLTIRAIHIEIAHSMTSDSFILCLRDFMHRRGKPTRIRCDNGTNFRGASKELQDYIKTAVDSTEIRKRFAEIEWVFIPPGAPHMGGSWERMVRTVKSTLMELKPTQRLPSDQLLRSWLIEVEHVVNSRPLTHVSVDPHDMEALTPNHFLIGWSSGTGGNSDGDEIGVQPAGEFSDDCLVLPKRWKISQYLADCFWRRWVKEVLPLLTRRTKWFGQVQNIKIDDVVVIVDPNAQRNSWPMGIVIDVQPGKDGRVRQATVKTSSGVYTRPVARLAILDVRVPPIGNVSKGESKTGVSS